jgi:hypothetical protein
MPYTGGMNVYRDKCDTIAADGYPGLLMSGHRTTLTAAAPVAVPALPNA